MPRDASTTRQKLLRAGEQLFATKGVDSALVRDIVRLAGQANDSAMHYHFGSRQGLLEAIFATHIEHMEASRRAQLERLADDGTTGDLDALVAAIVQPTAARLSDRAGRDFLRIIAQVSDRASVHDGNVSGPLAGTQLARQLELLTNCCMGFLPERVALERVAAAIMLLTAALADRAQRIDQRRTLSLDHETFVGNLVGMLAGALRAPAPTT